MRSLTGSVRPALAVTWAGGPIGSSHVAVHVSVDRSTTCTGKRDVALLPLASVAVQFTNESPTGATEPEAGLQLTSGRASTTSSADGAVYEIVAPAELVAVSDRPPVP